MINVYELDNTLRQHSHRGQCQKRAGRLLRLG
jgi:hypothetical protein